MFEYAAGRSLSIARGASFKLDISGFAGYSVHNGFELQQVFDRCPISIATEADIRNLLGWQFPNSIRRIMRRPSMAAIRRNTFVIEPKFNYWQEIKQSPPNCYLHGYFQSEKYFQDHAPTIREDFSFHLGINEHNIEVINHIEKVNAVSLHVRRGDYVKDPKAAANHGLCSLDYYRAAIKYVAERVDTPFFFVFSDDPVWVKENLQIDFSCRYIDHNQGAESYNDMRLMSLCKHHIIANSSFSWWGAWLNPRVDKIVIAPKKWFANANDVSDLFPPEWVIL